MEFSMKNIDDLLKFNNKASSHCYCLIKVKAWNVSKLDAIVFYSGIQFKALLKFCSKSRRSE